MSAVNMAEASRGMRIHGIYDGVHGDLGGEPAPQRDQIYGTRRYTPCVIIERGVAVKRIREDMAFQVPLLWC